MPSRRMMYVGGGVLVLFALILSLQTPRGGVFPVFVHVPSGATLHETAEILKENDVIVSAFLFKAFAVLTAGSAGAKAGDYLFEEPPRLVMAAWRITHADFDIEPTRVLIPEGTSVHEIAEILAQELNGFDTEKFIARAEAREGYLFPDTYFFLPNSTPETVIEILMQNFDEKIKEIVPDIEASGRTLADVVIMASILEEEAQTLGDKRIVSGILWKRLDDDMALQVDAPFVYIMGKGSADLTLEDLKTDSPYNTYVYRGLTPTAITNPGLDSLRAAAQPVASDYYFYLSDPDGKIYYAETFEEHKRNKELYL